MCGVSAVQIESYIALAKEAGKCMCACVCVDRAVVVVVTSHMLGRYQQVVPFCVEATALSCLATWQVAPL